MSLLLDLAPEVEHWLEEQSRRSGESISAVATGVLQRAAKRFVVKPFDLGPLPARFQGMTPSQINDLLETEDFLEKLERA